MSVSITQTRLPAAASTRAKLVETLVLPSATPALVTTMVFSSVAWRVKRRFVRSVR